MPVFLKAKLFGISGALLLLLGLSACTYEHALQKSDLWAGRLFVSDYFEIRRTGNERLAAGTRFYVPFIETKYGVEADVPQMEYICAGFKNRYPRTWCGLRPEKLEEAFINASGQGAVYLLHAKVVNWDNKRYWHVADDSRLDNRSLKNLTGIDQVVVEIVIYDILSRQIFDVIEMKARSALWQGYGNKPAELLRTAYRDLASALSPEKVL